MDEQLYDVVIYEIDSRKVDAVVGKSMSRDRGHYNAEKRIETAFTRINERYGAGAVKAGTADKGTILAADAILF